MIAVQKITLLLITRPEISEVMFIMDYNLQIDIDIHCISLYSIKIHFRIYSIKIAFLPMITRFVLLDIEHDM